jgi:uncharacterized protein DUF4132
VSRSELVDSKSNKVCKVDVREQLAELPDESSLQFPESWIRYILPRRDGDRQPNFNPLSESKALEICRNALADNLSALQILEQQNAPPNDIAVSGSALAFTIKGAKARRAWIDYLVASRGVSFATAALLHADLSVNQEARPEYEWEYNFYYRLRSHLAFASDEDYLKAKTVAELLRPDLTPLLQVRCASLFPTEQSWIANADGSDYRAQPWLLSILRSPEQASATLQHCQHHAFGRGPRSLYPTFVDSLGLAAGPLLAHKMKRAWIDADTAKKAAETLACFPQEEALDALWSLAKEHKTAVSAFRNAVQNFPRLALRVLSKRQEGELWVRQVLEMHPAALAAAQDDLDSEQMSWLESLSAGGEKAPVAAESKCPSFLISPPWYNRKQEKPVKLCLEQKPYESGLNWDPGQRDEWRSAKEWDGKDLSKEEYYATLAPWQTRFHLIPHYIAHGPPTAARQLLEEFEMPSDFWELSQCIANIVARFGMESLPLVKQMASSKLADAVPYFSPFDDADLCRFAAEAYGRLKSVRSESLLYLCRYPTTAAIALIPDAFGSPSKLRGYAEEALFALARAGLGEAVLRVAEDYGAAEAVEALLGRDPLDRLPKKIPDLPDWLESSLGLLPAPTLKSGEGALPEKAVRHLLVMLSISRPGDLYPGVELAAELLEPESLAEFAWQVTEIWIESGSPSKESWAFLALGWLGNDEVARRLVPLLRKWPGEGLHARAVQGLDVLTAIGSEVALMHLYGLSQKLKFKGLKNKAAEKVQEIATNRGLSTQELADRLVPDFGLDEDGALTLDYGNRTFTLLFDEQLKPSVQDETGKRLKNLPKPGKRDGEIAESEYARFKALKKDVRTVAKQQLNRLEEAMCHQRRWSSPDFQKFFLQHPLVIHLVRRLIWGVFENERVVASFRVAEDGTLADFEDEEFSLPSECVVGLPHRLELPKKELAAWGDILSDYELLQPFSQLDRDVYLRAEDHAETLELDVVKNRRVDTGKVLGLESRGWHRGEAQDGGVACWIYREFPESGFVTLDLEPGIAMGDPFFFKEQTLLEITLKKRANAWGKDSCLPFSRLTDVSYSEVVRDLETLVES